MSKCPKCGEKIKATYLKQACPKCGVNMLYYKLDERLEADAKQAEREVEAVNKFVNMLKDSTIKTPWHIVRLVLFFTPLASMCLPMFWAGHKNVSLITFIMSIINHGFDFGAMLDDKAYFFAVLSMLLVILISIVEIICSLFSATKKGTGRNIVAWGVNFFVLFALSIVAQFFGAGVKAGLIVTLLIYVAKLVLHGVIGKVDKNPLIALTCVFIVLSTSMLIHTFDNKDNFSTPTAPQDNQISVVSFNVASAFGTSLEDTDSMVRCDRFATYMNDIKPDFIGTQEMNSFWMNSLEGSLSEYESYGVCRGGDSEERNSEMNSVLWLKSDYEAIETNTIWLSETPDTESKYTYIDSDGNEAEAGCNRICTYAILDGKDGKQYAMMNTHLDNASEEARVFGASIVLSEIDKITAKYDGIKVILTGDFNETANEEAVKMLSEKLSRSEGENRATYQEWGYRNTGDMPIDFIFTNGTPSNYFVLDDISNGYVSDHYGIYSIIE